MIDFARFRNTYLQAPWLFPLVIRDRHFEAALRDRPRDFADNIQRALEKFIWFWPRVIDARIWANGAPGKLQTPLNFTTIDADARLLLDWVVKVCPDKDAPILDLGCNCGRLMIDLAGKGYSNLTGVDVMRSAIALFEERSPEVFRRAKVTNDLFQRFLLRQPDRAFELTYSHGATIELVHPSFDTVRHLCRVTRRHICLLLHENEAFRRDWIGQFAGHGFHLAHGMRPIAPGHGGSLIVLRRS
jgi:SAM-dependent methyltransferase